MSGVGIQRGVCNCFVKSSRRCVVSSKTSSGCLSPVGFDYDFSGSAEVGDDFGFDLVDVLGSSNDEPDDRALEDSGRFDLTLTRSSVSNEGLLGARQGFGRILSGLASCSIDRSRCRNFTALELNTREIILGSNSISFPSGDG